MIKFRYTPKDAYLVAYTFILAVLPFLMIWLQPSFMLLALLLPFHMWAIVNHQNGSLHHHSHWPTFESKKVNLVYELFLSMVAGIPHQLWKWAHLTHHVHVNDKPVNGLCKDPVSVFLYGKNGEPENFWKYCFIGTIKYLKDQWAPPSVKSGIKTPASINMNQYNREILLFKLYLLSILLLDWQYGLWMLLVYFLAYFFNNATSYGEHWTVLDRRGDTTQDSIGIYSRWYNFVGFGAGYHQEHHNQPARHWTKLHEITHRMHPNRKIVGGMHITNNPYWSHFKLLFKKEQA